MGGTQIGALLLVGAVMTVAGLAIFGRIMADRAKRVPFTGRQANTAGAGARLRTLPPVSTGGGDAAIIRVLYEGFYSQVERRLEHAFEQYLKHRIMLDTYQALVETELRAARQHLARLQAAKLEGEMDAAVHKNQISEAEDAIYAINWCLDWVVKHRLVPSWAA